MAKSPPKEPKTPKPQDPKKNANSQPSREAQLDAMLPGGAVRNLELERKNSGRPGRIGVQDVFEALGYRKPVKRFDEDAQRIYLEEVRRTGFLKLAAIRAGIKPETAQALRRSDPEFDEAVKNAQSMYQWDLLQEAHRRATEGVTRPIIGGQFKDEIVAQEQVYSDGLLVKLLDAQVDGFGKDSAGGAGGGGGGGVLIIPNRVESLDDWEAAYGEAAKGLTGRPAA